MDNVGDDSSSSSFGVFSLAFSFFQNPHHFFHLIVYFISITLSFPIESLLIPFLTGSLINELYCCMVMTDKNIYTRPFVCLFLFLSLGL